MGTLDSASADHVRGLLRRWDGATRKNNMKAMLVESSLILASSLFWIIVLPLAALLCSSIAISGRVEAFRTGKASVVWQQPGVRANQFLPPT